MSARSKARKRAVDILYEAELRELDPEDLLTSRQDDPVPQAPVSEYAAQIVRGVQEHRARIDEVLETYSQGWVLQRMPAVDRAILRMGSWEILFNDDVPDVVGISEAVDLATSLSTDDSPAFVNGLLARISTLKPSLLA